MWSYRFVLQDVSRVIDGFHVDGVSHLPKTVSFPRRPDVVDAVVGLTQVLYTFVGATQRSLADDAAARTALVFKLLAFLTRTGRVAPDVIRASVGDIAGVATILCERPELVGAPVNFAGILARHAQAQHERAARREEAQRDREPPPQPCRRRRRRTTWEREHRGQRDDMPREAIPSRPVIWESADRQHRLQELIHPWHLVEETRALGHCIGWHAAPHLAEDGNIHCLAYWQYIASGRSRVFSFAGPRGPLCTLHVQLSRNAPLLRHTLIETGPRYPLVLAGAEAYFPVLLEALAGLEHHLGCLLRFGSGRSVSALRRTREGPPGVADGIVPPRMRRCGGGRRMHSAETPGAPGERARERS